MGDKDTRGHNKSKGEIRRALESPSRRSGIERWGRGGYNAGMCLRVVCTHPFKARGNLKCYYLSVRRGWGVKGRILI